MIKQNWIVTEEERKRILSLHESATKKHYIFSEQKQYTMDDLRGMGIQFGTDDRPITKTDTKEISFFFRTGFWSERATDNEGRTIVAQVDNALKSIKSFLGEVVLGTVSNVKIISSESAVKNRDNENPDPKRGYLQSGELARRRSETLRNLLTQGFQGLVDAKLVRSLPQFEEEIKVGTATEKDSEEALKEQYVKAIFTIKGLTKTPTTETPPPTKLRCDFVLDLKVEYVPVSQGDDKWHNCNDAEFTLFIADVPIKLKNSQSEIFSLNNYPDARAVQQFLHIDPETASQIIAKGDIAKMEFQCMSANGCHEAPLQMTIFSDGVQVDGPKYMGRIGKRSDRMPRLTKREVAKIDKCGKLVSVEDIGDPVIDKNTKQGN